MTRVRIYGYAATGLALGALGWWVPTVAGAAAQGDFSRPIGLTLVGGALLGAGVAFRWAMKPAPVAKVPASEHRTGEFRQGFAAKESAPVTWSNSDNVVQLRRAVTQHAQTTTEPIVDALPSDEVERLKDLLHARAAKLRERNADVAKRQFMRSGVDIHGLAPS
jgi:hypothetical protein